MPIITSTSLIRFASVFHISLAFYFLTAPDKIVNQSLVFLLGRSMRLSPIQSQPQSLSLSTPSPASALIALLLALLGITDLGAFTLPEGPTGNSVTSSNRNSNGNGNGSADASGNLNTASRSSDTIPISVANVYWSTQSLIRSFFFFAVTGYAYLFRDSHGVRKSAGSGGGGVGQEVGESVDAGMGIGMGVGANLSNSLVFTLGFLETVIWYWTFLTLRQERRRKVEYEADRRRKEEDML